MKDTVTRPSVPLPSPEVEALLDQAMSLMRRGHFSPALDILDLILEDRPEQTDALYMKAACLRYRKQPRDALGVLGKLREIAPEYARGHQEAGHSHRSLGEKEHALQAYRQAVSLNPGLMASWKALAELEETDGNATAAHNANQKYRRLQELPRELVSVTSMIHEGKLYRAERLCRSFLRENPHHVEGMRLLAQLGSRLHVLDDAEFLLESALEFEPDNAFVHYDYVNVLNKRQKFRQALEQAKTLRRRQPGNPSFETAYATQCMAVGDHEEALQTYDRVLVSLPGNPNILLARGHALKTIGRPDEAISSYRAAYSARPDCGDAYWSLANLKTYRFNDAELEQMRRQEARRGTTLADRYHLCFALGKAYEDRGGFETSFRYYERGNALKKCETRYDADRMAAEMRRQKITCTRELIEARRGAGHPEPDPIFIVGLPRSGSTLVEQILSSHSQIDGTFELPNILAFAHRLNGRRKVTDIPRYPGVLEDLKPTQLEELGRRYIEETRIHRGGAPFFLDKMPNNFQHIGLIHLILPNARIIDARRHPMACCFSGFKQLFAEGQEFTYGLEDIGRYYRGYVDLMDHWNQVLPGRILQVRYEDVVADLDIQVRRMLDFLKLPYEVNCLEFHRTERSVRTASSEQVRQPIYRRGLAQWRHFEPWLGPLRTALGEELVGGNAR